MVEFLEALRNGVRNTFCLLSGPTAVGLQLGGNIYKGIGAEENGEDLIASANLLRNTQNIACNRGTENVSSQFPPFVVGGQCSGTTYTFNLSYDIQGSPPFQENNIRGVGPIQIGTQGLDFVLTSPDGISGLSIGWREFGIYTIGFTEIISNIIAFGSVLFS